MFEQSILSSADGKKRWTFAASILAEVSAVSVLLLIPLVYTESLGLGWIQSSVLHLPVPPRAPLQTERAPQRPPREPRHTYNPYDAPAKIPAVIYIPLIDEEPLAVAYSNPIPNSTSNDVIGSIGGTRDLLSQPQLKAQPKPAEVKRAEPPPSAPVTVSKGAQEARIIRRVIPAYPALAKQARVQGLVKLIGVISTDGRIEHLQVLSGHPLLVPAAVDAVRQWTYRPTLLNGVPVEVQAPIDVNFILSN